MEHIVISPVADSLTVFQNLLGEGVIEESLQIITAFSVVPMVGKERGNFNSVIFQCVAGAKQLILLVILMEELHIPCEVSVSSA